MSQFWALFSMYAGAFRREWEWCVSIILLQKSAVKRRYIPLNLRRGEAWKEVFPAFRAPGQTRLRHINPPFYKRSEGEPYTGFRYNLIF
jgi:hypothetical protein